MFFNERVQLRKRLEYHLFVRFLGGFVYFFAQRHYAVFGIIIFVETLFALMQIHVLVKIIVHRLEIIARTYAYAVFGQRRKFFAVRSV